MLIELLAEGTLEGAGVGLDAVRQRWMGRPDVPMPTPEATQEQAPPEEAPPSPIQQKQEQRAVANEEAARRSAEKVRGTQMRASLDTEALRLTEITQHVAAGTNQPGAEDIIGISDEAFVDTFENQIAPEITQIIQNLEDAGIQDAGNKIRSRMLELHQGVRERLEGERQETADVPPETPEPEAPQAAPETPTEDAQPTTQEEGPTYREPQAPNTPVSYTHLTLPTIYSV